jgi:hypothetical protein
VGRIREHAHWDRKETHGRKQNRYGEKNTRKNSLSWLYLYVTWPGGEQKADYSKTCQMERERGILHQTEVQGCNVNLRTSTEGKIWTSFAAKGLLGIVVFFVRPLIFTSHLNKIPVGTQTLQTIQTAPK